VAAHRARSGRRRRVSVLSVLSVIVPSRNEAAVIDRKLANLARCRWPQADRPHRIVVVDDGSDDETRSVARAAAERERDAWAAANVEVIVLENDVRPGKTGAIEQGLRVSETSVDLIVLTDADVVLSENALVDLAAAFESDRRIGVVCGSQRMVANFAADGSLASAAGAPFTSRMTFYDWATALVRRCESQFGAVFSVHGQLMAWRTELALRPTRGLAADDLDLMLQARCLGARVAFAPSSMFFEARPSEPSDRKTQRTRRARAFLQFLAHPRRAEFAAAGPLLWRLQAALYLHLPLVCLAVQVACFAVYAASWLVELNESLAWTLRIASVAIWLPLAIVVQRTLGLAGRAERDADRALRDHWETARK